MNPSSTVSSDGSSGYAWAEHLIWMEGGEPVAVEAKQSRCPGLLLAGGLALASLALGWWLKRVGGSAGALLDPILVSMLLGLAWGNLAGRDFFLPGISVAVRKLLPVGIVLLGARMNFLEALRVGVPGLLMSLMVVVVAVLLLAWLGRCFGLERKLAWLLGVGTGICGGTAIVAVAPLLKARDRDVIVGVGLVTLIGLAGMLILPAVAKLLALTEVQFGLLAGLTIHQTPQVIAAGFAYGEEAGQVATVAKLARVCLLAPVAVLLGWWMTRSEDGADAGAKNSSSRWYSLLPGFAIGFLVLAGIRTLGLLPQVDLAWSGPLAGPEATWHFDTAALLKLGSTFLLAVGMVGVGFQTRFSQGRQIGWRPVAAASIAALLIGAIVLFLILTIYPN